MQQKEKTILLIYRWLMIRSGYFSYCYRRGEFFTKNIFLRCNGFRRPFAGTRPHTLLEDPAPGALLYIKSHDRRILYSALYHRRGPCRGITFPIMINSAIP